MSEPISTTELNHRLGVTVPVGILLKLGVMPFAADGARYWWDEDQYLEICEALAKFIANGGVYLE